MPGPRDANRVRRAVPRDGRGCYGCFGPSAILDNAEALGRRFIELGLTPKQTVRDGSASSPDGHPRSARRRRVRRGRRAGHGDDPPIGRGSVDRTRRGGGRAALARGRRQIVDLRLEIYEPPRFFEAFLAGRHFSRSPTSCPRICGICPVAYQMSAIHGLERLFGVEVTAGIRELRRLLYCAEWIESHMLHVHLLAAPDFLGYDSAIKMASGASPRSSDRAPASSAWATTSWPRSAAARSIPSRHGSGASRSAPRRRDLRAFLPRLEWAPRQIRGYRGLRRLARRPGVPPAGRDGRRWSIETEYPINEGAMASTSGRAWDATRSRQSIAEVHVEHSNALHSVFDRHRDLLLPGSAGAREPERGAPDPGRAASAPSGQVCRGPSRDPFASMAARVVETALAIEESTG